MLKKYLQIIAVSVLFCSSFIQEAIAGNSPCCVQCIKLYSGPKNSNIVKSNKQGAYIDCIRKCPPGTICPHAGVPADLTGKCHQCLCDNLINGKIDFSDGSPYSKCIRQNKKKTMCPGGPVNYKQLNCSSQRKGPVPSGKKHR